MTLVSQDLISGGYFTWMHAWWAVALGALSAASLPLGSLAGIRFKPSPGITGAAAAFGAGALFAALSVELVAPTMTTSVQTHLASPGSRDYLLPPLAMIFGCIAGGLLFVFLDQIVNRHGGYLRKTATAITYLGERREKRNRRMLEIISRSHYLMTLSPSEVRPLVDLMRPIVFTPSEWLFQAGDPADRVFLVEEGEVDLIRDGRQFQRLGAGEIIGEVAVLLNSPRHVSARASGVVKAWMLNKADFERIRAVSPGLAEITSRIAADRLVDWAKKERRMGRESVEWASAAAKAVGGASRLVPDPMEIRKAAESHSGAPLAIWLGIFLDGIPESFVIGMTFLASLTAKMHTGVPTFLDVVPYTLIAGLFLSNFPEAMSASVGMRHQGWSVLRVLWLWTSLMLMTGLGAGLGYAIGADVPHAVTVLIEGVAAGAMLTMIAQTMIPEAVHLGGPNVTGLATLFGFLGAVAFKLLE
ncbi:MAG: cyclic nucleotide-binding domain-containing protein [Calditrichaeota bacterium]|nr:cyclic nucleotide-binding domain-containing protein [Calditrichota bacterium]